MDPNRTETTAALIARRPERLNILIGRSIDYDGSYGRPAFVGNVVSLRNGWTDIHDGDLPGDARLVVVPVPGRSRMDRTTLNRANQLGAFVVVPDLGGIERAVASLRAAWGNLHVQDNSGHCPHLHQGLFGERLKAEV